jgi:Secretion system C-terminal sorting domain
MKKVLIFFLIVFSVSKLQAQIISPEFITSDGDFYSNSAAMLSFAEGVVVDDCNLKPSNSIINKGIVSNLITIYPNPANDKITIEISGKTNESNLAIVNIEGQELITRQITAPKTLIDISNLPSGVYFVRLTNNKTVSTWKFIKQ